MTVKFLINHLRHIAECLSYCKFPLQMLLGFIPAFGIDLWFFAVINFNVTLQHRFPTHTLSLPTKEDGSAVSPTLCGHQS